MYNARDTIPLGNLQATYIPPRAQIQALRKIEAVTSFWSWEFEETANKLAVYLLSRWPSLRGQVVNPILTTIEIRLYWDAGPTCVVVSHCRRLESGCWTPQVTKISHSYEDTPFAFLRAWKVSRLSDSAGLMRARQSHDPLNSFKAEWGTYRQVAEREAIYWAWEVDWWVMKRMGIARTQQLGECSLTKYHSCNVLHHKWVMKPFGLYVEERSRHWW